MDRKQKTRRMTRAEIQEETRQRQLQTRIAFADNRVSFTDAMNRIMPNEINRRYSTEAKNHRNGL